MELTEERKKEVILTKIKEALYAAYNDNDYAGFIAYLAGLNKTKIKAALKKAIHDEATKEQTHSTVRADNATGLLLLEDEVDNL